jgi:Tol biopolymer transport system component
MSRHFVRAAAALLACAVLPIAPLAGQATSNAAAVAGPASTGGGAKKPLNLEDYGRWVRIGGTAISPDGKWMSYTLTPNENGSPTLHLKPIDGGNEIVINLGGGGAGGRGGRGGRGGGGGGGGGAAFSDDSKWVTYTVAATAGRGGGRGGRGDAPPGGRGAAPAGQQAAPSTRLILRNLNTGDTTSFQGVASSSFSPGSKYLVLRMSQPQGAAPSPAADIVLRDLATGAHRNIGNVAQFAFNDDGRLLAYTVDAPEKLGNGVFLFNAATGQTETLVEAKADFDGMAWNDAGTGLMVMRGEKPAGRKHRSNVLLAWSGIGAGAPRAFVYDAAKDPAFPTGFVLSEYSAPRWSDDGSRFFVGIKEQEAEIPAADSIRANVDIWHWKDVQPQSQQIQQVNNLRRATVPGVVFVNRGTFVKLGDDEMRTVAVAGNDNVGVGRNDAAYRGEMAAAGRTSTGSTSRPGRAR